MLVPAVALVFSLTRTPTYEATASLLFRDPGFDQKLFGSSYLPPSRDPSREEATNLQLVSLEEVSKRASAALNGRLSPNEVAARVSASPAGQSNVIRVKATDPDPAFAALLANTVARQYVLFRQSADRDQIRHAQSLVQAQLRRLDGEPGRAAERQSLAERETQLEILAALQTGNAELVQPAQAASDPSSPQPARNTILGLLTGIALGLMLAGFFDRRDRTLRDLVEVGEIFGRPVIGSIVDSRELAAKVPGAAPAREAESFRLLRANLRYFNVQRNLQTLLVTSAGPAEGKSTVAYHLAATYARAGERTVVIEGDLRHPGLPGGHEQRRAATPGLSSVLLGDATLEQAVVSTPVADGEQSGLGPTVDVLYAGPLPPDPAELLESDRTRALFEELRETYDTVIVDTPPIKIVSDAIPLVRMVDAVIVVARVGTTTREAAAELKSQLDNMAAFVPGVVLNGVEDNASDYYYYYYGSGRTDRPARPPERVRS